MPKLFLQDSPNDCAAACLATILHAHGMFVTPIDLIKQLEVHRGGVTSTQLSALAAHYGLQTRLIKLEIADFGRLKDPCIAYMETFLDDGGHNVVILKVKGKKLLIGDPARGVIVQKIDDFAKNYTGRVMIFRVGPEFKTGKVSEPYHKKFYRFVSAYRFKILQSLMIGLVASSLAFGLIYLSKYYIDEVLLPKQGLHAILVFSLVYFLAKLFNVFAVGVNELFNVHLKNAIFRLLSLDFFKRSLGLEKRHIDSRDAGDFLLQFTQIDQLTRGISSYFSNFILVVFGIMVKAGFLIALYDPTLVGIILPIIAINAFVGFLFSKSTAEHANRQSLFYSKLNTTILSGIADIRVIRVFDATEWIRESFQGLLAEVQRLIKKIANLNVFGRSVAELLNLFSEAAIFIICGMRIIADPPSYTIGDFVVFLTFAQGLAAQSLQFPGLILAFQTQLRAYARLQAILELSQEQGGKAYQDREAIEIEFKNVTFGYQREVPVLQNLSCSFASNQTTAIVGESGSGKTTLINLAMGFYTPWSGSILINGVDINDIDLVRYRRDISAVFQETPIFNKNIYHNVTMGDEKITLERVKEVAELLGINEFIERFPQSYKYLIYPGALSGGQTQRIGILRALCKPFKLLILDEATSHLDSLTEEKIVNGIKHLSKPGKTRIIIAHRLSTVMEADQILVLKGGILVEVGTHLALIENKGYYMDLIQRQYEVNLTPAIGGGA